MTMEHYHVVKCPTTELSYTNRAILNPKDSFAQQAIKHIAVRYPEKKDAFVFSVALDKSVEPKKIAFNGPGRKWASILTESIIQVAPYLFDPSQCLSTITFYTDFSTRQNAPINLDFDTADMAKQFSGQFIEQAFTLGQRIGFVYHNNGRKFVLDLVVKELEAVNFVPNPDESLEIGLTTGNTVVMFEAAEGAQIKLIGPMTSEVTAPKLFSQNWDFETMGVGGLSTEFNHVFRRAFASRLLPPHLAQKMGGQHVRGMLLYGPPGTGKTLLARQIGKALLAREPKIVNGPEILNKFVGESEANIRKLFAEAEEEQARAGINSGLHVIIFDEIDSICKARGNSASSSGVGDSVVNQLLTKIDGVNALHNVLLIGMTNRKDLIDEALLRPGRFELQIEIGLPNVEGRLEIFKIHTKNMRDNNFLDPSVDLNELAECTKNFTGAEIEGLVRAAMSLAINRVVKIDSEVAASREELENIRVTRDDFQYAMKHDVKPALGASEDQLNALAKPIIQWDPSIEKIQSDLSGIIRQVSNREAGKGRPYFVLLIGEAGSGRTTLAANMAAETKFPFIRIYNDRAAGENENARVQYMKKLFDDATKSEFSCVLIDDLEDIIDYSKIGPRFSNTARIVFNRSKNLSLPKDHRMLVICTCRFPQFLDDLSLFEMFDYIIDIPSLTKPDQVGAALMAIQETGDSTFTTEQCHQLVNACGSIPFKMGIKQLERLTDHARRNDPPKRVKSFLECMHTLKLVIRQSRLDHPFEF